MVCGRCTFPQGGTLMPHRRDSGGNVKTEYDPISTVYPNDGLQAGHGL
jgi:hypothetical protein